MESPKLNKLIYTIGKNLGLIQKMIIITKL